MKKACILLALISALATAPAYGNDVEVYNYPYGDAHIIRAETFSEATANLSDTLIWALYTYQGVNELEAVKSTLNPATAVENDSDVIRKFNQSAKSLVHSSL